MKYECNVHQLSSGAKAKAGAEASAHLMKTLFDENSKNGWGLFLGDADNAFNRINRPAMLWNVRFFGQGVQDSCSTAIEVLQY